MVDSRAKGRTAELKARDILRQHTGLPWERTPMSGALNAAHGLKGDIYIPNSRNTFCIEVKSYKDDHLTSKILSNKNPQFMEWWDQACRQAEECRKLPLLLFKYNRSKWFVAVGEMYAAMDLNYICLYDAVTDSCVYVYLLEDWIKTLNAKDFVDGETYL